MVKNPTAYAGDTGDAGSIPRSGRFPKGGDGYPLQYSCWRIPWTEEPAGYSPWSRKELDPTEGT